GDDPLRGRHVRPAEHLRRRALRLRRPADPVSMTGPLTAGSAQGAGAVPAAFDVPSTLIARPPTLPEKFVRHRGAVIGLVALLIIIAIAISGAMLVPFNPYESNPDVVLKPPQPNHLFGTDDLGRDVATRMIYGASLSLLMGFLAVGFAVVLGLVLGLPSGYY